MDLQMQGVVSLRREGSKDRKFCWRTAERTAHGQGAGSADKAQQKKVGWRTENSSGEGREQEKIA